MKESNCCTAGLPTDARTRDEWAHHAAGVVMAHNPKDVWWATRGTLNHPRGEAGMRGLRASWWHYHQVKEILPSTPDIRDTLEFACRVLYQCGVDVNRLRALYDESRESPPCQLLRWESQSARPRMVARTFVLGLDASFVDMWLQVFGETDSLNLALALCDWSNIHLDRTAFRQQVETYLREEECPARELSFIAALLDPCWDSDPATTFLPAA